MQKAQFKTEIVDANCGFKVEVFADDYIGDKIKRKGVYENAAIIFLRAMLSRMPNAIALDIGANIGNHVLHVADLTEHLYAFEPQPEVAAVLKGNLQRNEITNVTVCEFGLSDKNETLSFYQNLDGNIGASTFHETVKSDNNKCVELEVKVGDECLQAMQVDRVDLIKLDVEGFEAEVLAGLKAMIAQSQPVIMMEWNSEQTREAFSQRDIFNTVLKDYEMKSILSNYSKRYWSCKHLGKQRRSIHKLLNAETYVFEGFNFADNYANLVLCPKAKRALLFAE
jgi:FkbM family methyltransferase